jgi:hypothetical protein
MQEVREKALELYWGRLSARLISQHLGIPDGTIKSWIQDYGHKRERVKTAETMQLIPPYQQMKVARTATEWYDTLKALASSPTKGNGPPIHLACEKITGANGGIGQLATIISDNLKQNPLSGEIFAFCCNDGTVVTTIGWKGDMYTVVKYHRAHGSYIWPPEDFGLSVTVLTHEFEYLLTCYKEEKTKLKNIKSP